MKHKKKLFIIPTLIIILSLLYTLVYYLGNFYMSPAYGYISRNRMILDTIETMETIDTVEYDYIELYDIKKERVVLKEKSSPEAETFVLEILKSITSLYIDISPIPEAGYIMRIPFKTPLDIKKYWPDARNISSIDAVFLFSPEDKSRAPYLMILDNNAHPIFLNFNFDIKPFLKMINFDEIDLS